MTLETYSGKKRKTPQTWLEAFFQLQDYLSSLFYLQQLIDGKQNGLIKIITGIRRCGKSYLLFTLFKQHLIANGILTMGLLDFLMNPDSLVM